MSWVKSETNFSAMVWPVNSYYRYYTFNFIAADNRQEI
jgi:hypothetical protein